MVDRQQIFDIMILARREQGLPDYTPDELKIVTEVFDEVLVGDEGDTEDIDLSAESFEKKLISQYTPDAPVDAAGWAIPGFTPGGPPLKKTVIPEGGFPVAVPADYARQNAEPQASKQPVSPQQAPGERSPSQQPQGAGSREPAPAEPDSSLPAPHPAFAAAFTAGFYLDQGDDYAPFGSDEASDSVAELLQMRRRIVPTTNLRPLVAVALEEEPASVFENLDIDEEHVNAVVIGVGFLLILLTGRIDDEGRRQVIAALERQEQIYGEDTDIFRTMLADLRAL